MEILGLSTIIALFSLDQKHVFQLALSQPLILATVIGLFTGHFEAAIYIGIFVQLVWLGNLPVGASRTPEGNIASAVGCMLYVQFNESYASLGELLLLLTFSYIILVSFLGGQLDSSMRNFSIRLFDYSLKNIHDDKRANIGKIVFSTLAMQFIINLTFILSTFYFGKEIFSFLQKYFIVELNPLWQYVDLAIIGVGIGMVISVYKGRYLKEIIAIISLFSLILFKII